MIQKLKTWLAWKDLHKIEKIIIISLVFFFVTMLSGVLLYDQYQEYSMKKQGFVWIGDTGGFEVWVKTTTKKAAP